MRASSRRSFGTSDRPCDGPAWGHHRRRGRSRPTRRPTGSDGRRRRSPRPRSARHRPTIEGPAHHRRGGIARRHRTGRPSRPGGRSRSGGGSGRGCSRGPGSRAPAGPAAGPAAPRPSASGSVTSTLPASACQRVTSTFVSGRYRCRWRGSSSSGSIVKSPPFSGSSRAAKTDGPSNRGQHMKSIAPSLATRAQVTRSPTMPWSSIGRGMDWGRGNVRGLRGHRPKILQLGRRSANAQPAGKTWRGP